MTTFTQDEQEWLRSMVIAYIDEGFTTPPYDPELYTIIQKLGISQADVRQYDITPPSQVPDVTEGSNRRARQVGYSPTFQRVTSDDAASRIPECQLPGHGLPCATVPQEYSI